LPITVNEDGKFTSLKAAVDAAPPGSIITVCPGTYSERIVVERPLTLLGAGQDVTIFDGKNQGTQIFVDAVDIRIDGFTFINGESEYFFSGNFSCGGALAVDVEMPPQTVVVSNSTFTDNHGEWGGAICIGGTIWPEQNVTLENVTIDNNSAEFRGGGVYTHMDIAVNNSTITNNTAETGAGMYVTDCDGKMVNTVVQRNVASEEGGGMWLDHNITYSVSGSDWGIGAGQDNAPDDVGHNVDSYGFYGNDVSFFCSFEFNEGQCNP